MASLTMEPKDWDDLRDTLQKVPKDKQDEKWQEVFWTVKTVTGKLRMEGKLWSLLRSKLEEVPQANRDRKWKKVHGSVDFVCQSILDLRDMIKDARGPDDQGPHDAEGIWP